MSRTDCIVIFKNITQTLYTSPHVYIVNISRSGTCYLYQNHRILTMWNQRFSHKASQVKWRASMLQVILNSHLIIKRHVGLTSFVLPDLRKQLLKHVEYKHLLQDTLHMQWVIVRSYCQKVFQCKSLIQILFAPCVGDIAVIQLYTTYTYGSPEPWELSFQKLLKGRDLGNLLQLPTKGAPHRNLINYTQCIS